MYAYVSLQVSVYARESRSAVSFGIPRSRVHEGEIRAHERMVPVQGEGTDVLDRYYTRTCQLAIIPEVSSPQFDN
jgi:hypothetical protein